LAGRGFGFRNLWSATNLFASLVGKKGWWAARDSGLISRQTTETPKPLPGKTGMFRSRFHPPLGPGFARGFKLEANLSLFAVFFLSRVGPITGRSPRPCRQVVPWIVQSPHPGDHFGPLSPKRGRAGLISAGLASGKAGAPGGGPFSAIFGPRDAGGSRGVAFS